MDISNGHANTYPATEVLETISSAGPTKLITAITLYQPAVCFSSFFSPPIIIRILIPPKPSVMFLKSQIRDSLDLLLREMEAGELGQVLLQPLLLRAGRNSHNPLIKRPPQRHIPLSDIILFGELFVLAVHRPRRRPGDARKTAVPTDSNPLLPMVLEQTRFTVLGNVLQVGVEFNLVDCRRYLGCLKDGLEVFLDVIRDADGPGAARGLYGFHFGPFRLEDLWVVGEKGRVDQIQVHVV